MRAKKGFKGFTLVEMVIVMGVIAILAAVLIPTFATVIGSSRSNVNYEKANKVASDYFLENSDLESASDMSDYYVIVNGKDVYKINSNGEVPKEIFGVVNEEFLDEMEEEGYIEVTDNDDEGVVIYQPAAESAYTRAIHARNSYRRSSVYDKSYYEMANYIIKVADQEDTTQMVYFQVQYSETDPSLNGKLLEINTSIDELAAMGYVFEQCAPTADWSNSSNWTGIIYEPTSTTQLTYRIEGIQENASSLAHNDENVRDGNFLYVVDGVLYRTNNSGIVYECGSKTDIKTGVYAIDDEEETVTLEDYLAEGYRLLLEDNVGPNVSVITEAHRDRPVYGKVECYAIHYGYIDTEDVFHNWTDFRQNLLGVGLSNVVSRLSYNKRIDFSTVKKLIVSNSVSIIDEKAFSNYTSLEAIVLPEGMSTIGGNPFANGVISEIRINEDSVRYTDYNNNAILYHNGDSVVLLAGVPSLVSGTYLPDVITELGAYSFENTSISEINIVDKAVNAGVFKDCANLISVSNNIEREIPEDMFNGCILLQYFTMTNTIETIGARAFKDCMLLEYIDVNSTYLSSIGEDAFAGTDIDGHELRIKYSSSKKTFEANVTTGYIPSTSIPNVSIEYALYDITYVMTDSVINGVALEANPLLLNPRSEDSLEIISPDQGYKYKFILWQVKGSLTNAGYDSITEDGEGKYMLVQNNYGEDITLTAKFEKIVYKITYKVNNSTWSNDNPQLEFHPKEYNITSNSSLTIPELSKTGYTFDGWYLSGQKIGTTFVQKRTLEEAKDVVLTSEFRVVTYTISYILNGGTVANNNPTEYNIESGLITLENPTKGVYGNSRDYDFIGWTWTVTDPLKQNIDDSQTVTDPQISAIIETGSTGNRVYTANYTAVRHTITYDYRNGTVDTENITSFTVEEEDFDIYEPSKMGFTCTGWSDGVNTLSTTDKFVCANYHGDVNLVAQYTPNVYRIIYTGDHVRNYNNVTTFTYGNPITLKNPEMNTGYQFTEWTEPTGHLDGSRLFSDERGPFDDITITANSRVIEYTIDYELRDGVLEDGKINPIKYHIETPTFTLNNPIKTGYTFVKWTGSDNKQGKTITIETGSYGNKTYTANWEVITYTISYDLAGGEETAENPVEYTFESSNITLSNPRRTGYTFTGWSGTDCIGEKNLTVVIKTRSIGNRSFTAHWIANIFNISYNLNGGVVIGDQNPTTYTIETPDFTLNNPQKKGYTFAYWTGTDIPSTAEEVTVRKGSLGDREFTASYNTIRYTISYELNSGTLASQNREFYTIETETFTLTNPSRRGYSFLGWDGRVDDEGIITDLDRETTVTIINGSTGNRSYTAQWNIITYRINYVLDGGTATNPTEFTVNTNTFVLNNPTKVGYTFTGWKLNDESAKSITITIPKGSVDDRRYTATFSIITYTIEYNLDNGVYPGTPKTLYDVTTPDFEVKALTKTGYTFTGWTGTVYANDQTTVTGTLDVLTDHFTITKGSIGHRVYDAHFNIVVYTISYSLDGGSLPAGKSNPTTYTVETPTFTLNNPEKAGYDFDGWIGTNVLSYSKEVIITRGTTGNLTYNVRFTRIKYDIWYTLNDGEVSVSNPSEYYVESENITLNNPTKTGYTFAGWKGVVYARGTNTVIDNITTPTMTMVIRQGSIGDRNYIATYTPVTYSISYDLNGGSTTASMVTSYNIESEDISLPAKSTMSKSGYDFTGWSGSNGSSPQETVRVSKGSTGNKSYKANWTLHEYSLTYNYNGGTATNKTTYNMNTASFTLSNPSRSGYTFTGYSGTGLSGSNNTSVTIPSGSTGNRSFTAYWSVVTYSISYSLNSGSVSGNPSSYTVETATFTLKNPTRTGYTFTGWSGSGSGTSVSIAKGSTGNKSFSASWTPATYTCYLNRQGGTGGTASTTVTYTQAMPTITAPTRSGYKFLGYYKYTDISSGLSGYTKSSSWASDARDCMNGNVVSVVAGRKYRVLVTAKRWKGSLMFNGGIWYDNRTSGDPWEGVGGAFTQYESVGDGWAKYYKDVTVPSGKTGGRIYFQFEQGHNDHAHGFYFAEMSILDMTTGVQYVTALGGSNHTWNTTANGTLYANWQLMQFWCTFNHNGGSGGFNKVKFTYGTRTFYGEDNKNYSAIGVDSRNGYSLQGYDISGTRLMNASGQCVRDWTWQSDQTAVAQWSRIQYSISYGWQEATGPGGHWHPTSYNVDDDFTIGWMDTWTDGHNGGRWNTWWERFGNFHYNRSQRVCHEYWNIYFEGQRDQYFWKWCYNENSYPGTCARNWMGCGGSCCWRKLCDWNDCGERTFPSWRWMRVPWRNH